MPADPLHVTTRDGSEIVAYDLGGAGETLLMSHATGLHGHVFQPLVGHLQDRFHCYSIDHRAHGDSRASASWTGDWRGFADDLLSTVRALHLTSPIGFGHSSGGAAMLLAEETEPGTFSSLYCFEPVIFPEDDTPSPNFENPLSAGALRRRETFGSFEEAVAYFETRPLFASADPEALIAYVRDGFEQQADGQIRLKCRPADEARIYAYANSHRTYSRLGDVTCPVTLVSGSTSEWSSPGLPEALAIRLRHRSIDVMAGMGHFGPLERPDLVAASMIRAVDTPPA